MKIINLVTVLINCLLVLFIFVKFSELKILKEDYFSLKKELEQLLQENSWYLADFNEKIIQAERLVQDLQKVPKLDDIKNKENKYNPVTLEIAKLLQEGKSVTEIAEKLKTTKGEVVLRLNLGEKIAQQK